MTDSLTHNQRLTRAWRHWEAATDRGNNTFDFYQADASYRGRLLLLGGKTAEQLGRVPAK